MSNLNTLFQFIKDDFCSLWSCRTQGNTIEIITPYGTTNDKFVSVFITQQNDEFVVTDGGWLQGGSYDIEIDVKDTSFDRLFQYYVAQYDIRKVEAKNSVFYYKKTKSATQVPSIVFELSNFLSAIISACHVQFQDVKEKEEINRFRKQASDYIVSFVPKQHAPKFNHYLDDKSKTVRFGAIIAEGNQLTLVNYITGSSFNYFIGCIGKAMLNFSIASSSPYSKYIKKKISLVNDLASGYHKGELHAQMQELEKHTGTPLVSWTEKEKLRQYVA